MRSLINYTYTSRELCRRNEAHLTANHSIMNIFHFDHTHRRARARFGPRESIGTSRSGMRVGFDALERSRPPALDVVNELTPSERWQTSTAAESTSTPRRALANEREVNATRRRVESSPVLGGKSAARAAVERALGGPCEYALVSRRARASAEAEAANASARDEDAADAWRAYPDEDTRAFAIEARGEIERRIRAFDETLADERWRARERERAADDRERRSTATTTGFTRTRAPGLKTSVAFGTTVRG